MPLRYERAFGGEDPHGGLREPRNPVGVGFSEHAEHLVGRPAPNVELPEAPLTSWRQRPPPAGLGPVAPRGSPRVELAGTYDAAWQRERMPLWPRDFYCCFFHAAPLDQQVPGHLREGTRVEASALTPAGLLRFDLPRTRPWLHVVRPRDRPSPRAAARGGD